MNLSPHFSLAEMLESQTARRKQISEQFTPPEPVIANLALLCTHILEPLRIALGKPIQISSGYRCKRLNKAVGGVPTSQHVLGQAVDLQGVEMSNTAIFKKIKMLGLPYDQLIWEYGTRVDPAWVHVSYGVRNRRQILYVGV